MVHEKKGDKVIPMIASANRLEALFRLQSMRVIKSESRSTAELKRQRSELGKAKVAGICGQSTRREGDTWTRSSRNLHTNPLDSIAKC